MRIERARHQTRRLVVQSSHEQRVADEVRDVRPVRRPARRQEGAGVDDRAQPAEHGAGLEALRPGDEQPVSAGRPTSGKGSAGDLHGVATIGAAQLDTGHAVVGAECQVRDRFPVGRNRRELFLAGKARELDVGRQHRRRGWPIHQPERGPPDRGDDNTGSERTRPPTRAPNACVRPRLRRRHSPARRHQRLELREHFLRRLPAIRGPLLQRLHDDAVERGRERLAMRAHRLRRLRHVRGEHLLR